MPLPKPKDGESREDFVARCMTSEAAKEFETKDKDGKNQRLAVCEAQYDDKDKKKSEPDDEFEVRFTHNSTLADGEPKWGDVDKTALPRIAFAEKGEAGKKSTWGYPHHWVKGGTKKDEDGIWTDGTLYLHKGGLAAAWSAAQGGHGGGKADEAVIAHLERHRKAIGVDDASKEKEKDDAKKKDKGKSMIFKDERYAGQFRISEFVTRAADGSNAADLPPGCCAKMTGVALVYNVTDDYGTRFAPGCLAKTIAEKVRPGKVRLFADHEARTKAHVGTVTDIKDVGDTAVMTAVIFDTEAGRAMKEYLQAVTESGKVTGAVTGLSVGFRSREDESVTIDDGDGPQWACLFKEIELREISVTPVNAVPGTDVIAVRRERRNDGEKDQGLLTRMLARILAEVPESEAQAVFKTVYASAADPAHQDAAPTGATPAAQPAPDGARGSESSTASAVPKAATLEERRKILRETMGTTAAAAAT